MNDLETTSNDGGSIAALRRLYDAGQLEVFVVLAEALRGSGDLAAARRILEGGLKRDPRRVSGWVLLARLRAQLGELEGAREHYRKVLYELDPFNLPALRALSDAAMEAKDLLLAQDYMRRWEQEDPEDPELAELLEEVQGALESQGQEMASRRAAEGGFHVHDMSLAELERDVMPAPSVENGEAWQEPEGASGGGQRRKGTER